MTTASSTRSESVSPALIAACALFDLDPDGARLLGGYESQVYEVAGRGRPQVLRLTSSRRRTRDEVIAELEWVTFLDTAGVRVARTALSVPEAVRALPAADGYLTAVLFERAPGRPFRREDWSPPTVERWGELLATMHRLARQYVPRLPYRRLVWRDDVRYRAEDHVPAADDAFHRAWRALSLRLAKLPVDPAHHGLIHADVGPENMMLDPQDGAITLLDFADSVYSWFAHDLACSIVEARYFCRSSAMELPPWFMAALVDGYRRRQDLGPGWEEWLDDFLELQELERHIARHRVTDG